jgi:DNA-binding GntR family transcriptional regulator
MPPRPPAVPKPKADAASRYELVATGLRAMIEDGSLPRGNHLPAIKDIAAEHAVSFGTAQRAVSLLKTWGLVDVVRGHRATVL